MTYATQQDLVDRFGQDEIRQLSDRDGLGAIGDAAVARALGDTATLVDGYLMGRYALPIAGTVPPLLVALACDVARYKLHTIDAPELVRRNYEDALKRLAEIQAGRIVLAIAGVEPASADPSRTGILVSAPERVFSRETLDGF
jgi:phage gp36-like protein